MTVTHVIFCDFDSDTELLMLLTILVSLEHLDFSKEI